MWQAGPWRDKLNAMGLGGCSSARLQPVALDHAGLDHAGVQRQEHDAGVQAVARLEGGFQARFDRFSQA